MSGDAGYDLVRNLVHGRSPVASTVKSFTPPLLLLKVLITMLWSLSKTNGHYLFSDQDPVGWVDKF